MKGDAYKCRDGMNYDLSCRDTRPEFVEYVKPVSHLCQGPSVPCRQSRGQEFRAVGADIAESAMQAKAGIGVNPPKKQLTQGQRRTRSAGGGESPSSDGSDEPSSGACSSPPSHGSRSEGHPEEKERRGTSKANGGERDGGSGKGDKPKKSEGKKDRIVSGKDGRGSHDGDPHGDSTGENSKGSGLNGAPQKCKTVDNLPPSNNGAGSDDVDGTFGASAVPVSADVGSNRRQGNQWLKPPKFNGTGSIDTFLSQFGTCAKYNKWSDDDKCAFLQCALEGSAGQLLWDSCDPAQLTFEELSVKLRRRYGSIDQVEKYQAELRSRRRQRGETLAELHQDIRRIMALAYPTDAFSRLGEAIARDAFLAALDDRELAAKILEKEVPTLDAASKWAIRLEALAKTLDSSQSRDSGRGRVNRTVNDDIHNRMVDSDGQQRNNERVINELQQQLQNLQYGYAEMGKELDRQRLLQQQRAAALDVAPAATRAPLRAAAPANLQGAPTGPPGNVRRPLECYRCHGLGHIARHCRSAPTTQKEPENRVNATGTEGDVAPRVAGSNVVNIGHVSGSTPGKGKAAYLCVTIDGENFDCLLDTGSEMSIIPYRLVQGVDLQSSDKVLRAANGSALRVLGSVELQMTIGNQPSSVKGLVSDNVCELMLGIDWLTAHEALWDFEKAEVVLDGEVHPLVARRPVGWCRRVVLQEDSVVPPRAESVVMAKVEIGSVSERTGQDNGPWMTKVRETNNGLLVARSVLPDRLVNVPVRVMNLSTESVLLGAGEPIANLESVEVMLGGTTAAERSDPTNQQKEKLIQDMMSKVHGSIEASDRQKLYELLVEYADVLSMEENDLGHSHVFQHFIDTGDARPVRQPLRRHPPAHLDAIQQHVSDMLRQGVIEPAQSPWASNIVLAKKKDGTLRCCIDYRQLNSVTKKDAYPLPRIDMCLDAMSGATWFSTFDLRSSYHQVELNVADAEKTAFVCREGLFQFKMMPFGLCNAGATFSG